MHDLGGFALLLIGLLLGAILLFQFVLPLLMTWALGTLTYLAAAFLLVRSGRVHPGHLDSYLKPGLPWALLAIALGLPSLHGLYLFATEPGDLWPWIVGINAILPLTMTARLLIRHMRQKRRYVREGHDIEDLMDRVQARIATLEVRSDLLALAGSLHHEPEAWELLAGLPEDSLDVRRAEFAEAEARLGALREALVQISSLLERALAEVRAGTPSPPPTLTEARTRLDGVQAAFDRGIAQTQALVTEVLPGTLGPVG